jgi:ribosome-associated toxin RatA of RatAB toxin-antitoxin module
VNTSIAVAIRAEPERIFGLAARVEDWPRLLPHYRWVRILRDDGRRRVMEMAARRDGIPVRWTAVQEQHPDEGLITFHHVRGVTRGMDVAWTLRPIDPPGTTLVHIWHGFEPRWPLVPDRLVELVVGQYFVNGIAARTLAGLRAYAEATGSARAQGSGLGARDPKIQPRIGQAAAEGRPEPCAPSPEP